MNYYNTAVVLDELHWRDLGLSDQPAKVWSELAAAGGWDPAMNCVFLIEAVAVEAVIRSKTDEEETKLLEFEVALQGSARIFDPGPLLPSIWHKSSVSVRRMFGRNISHYETELLTALHYHSRNRKLKLYLSVGDQALKEKISRVMLPGSFID